MDHGICIKSVNGLLAQTKLLAEWFQSQGCKNALYLPGCRPFQNFEANHREPSNQLIIFLGHITKLKGPLVLLEALQVLEKRQCLNIVCDFYGPIHDNVASQFIKKIQDTQTANYGGMVDPGMGSKIISQYDLLILPTCYETEGHPGVLIEAMHVGVPVIATQKRTLYELITPGENGLLVPAGDVISLANAIELMKQNSEMRLKMGKANFAKGYDFRSDVVVEKLVKILFNDLRINSQ